MAPGAPSQFGVAGKANYLERPDWHYIGRAGCGESRGTFAVFHEP